MCACLHACVCLCVHYHVSNMYVRMYVCVSLFFLLPLTVYQVKKTFPLVELPPFPPKKLLPLDDVQMEERRFTIEKFIQACEYMHMYTYIRMYVRTYMYTYIRMYVRTYMYTYIRMYVRTYMYTYVHTHVCTYVRTCTHTYACMYVHTYTHAYIRTYAFAIM